MTDTQDCKFCNRRGLPLLPMRLAYVPNGLANLPAPILGGSKLGTQAVEGRYMLRVITQGYVYTYDARSDIGWRCFAATPDGRFREYVLADEGRPAATPAFRCAMKGHGIDASLVSVENALEGSEVWVGYSRAWLTRNARKMLRGDATLRAQLMTRINPRSLVTGGAVAPADGFRISASGAELQQHVLEYGDAATAAQRYAYTWQAALDRSAEPGAQAKRMHELSPGNAIALALGDPVGISQDISKWRNFKAGELAKYQTERKNLREQVVADIIEGLRKQAEDAKQPDQWRRLSKHVDLGRVEAVRTAYQKKVEEFEAVILRCAKDWCSWQDRDDYWSAWKLYDGTERSVGQDMECDFQRCIEGSGATKIEQHRWDRMLAADVDGNRNALWLALAAGDKQVLDFLADKGDKATDAFKNAREGRDKLGEWLSKRRREAAVRAATQETGLIGNAISSQVARLFETAPQQAQVVGMRLRVLAAARMDIEVSPYRLRVAVRELVAMSFETIWGPPTPRLTKTVLEARRLRILQSMDGVVLGAKASVAQVVELDMWLPRPVVDQLLSEGKLPSAARSAALPAAPTTLALPGPAANPFRGFLKWAKGADAKLVGIGAALQMWNLSNALGSLRTAELVGNTDAVREAWFGIASGISGLGGVTMEVLANSVKARVVPAVAAATSTKLLTVVGWTTMTGGLLAMGAAWVEGVQAFAKARRLARSGDADSATSYKIGGGLLMASGLAGAAVAVANAGVAFSSAGITASAGGIAGAAVGLTSAGTVLLGIPVWGWIALGIVVLVAGVWFLFQGSKEEDTPLEVWLSRCCLRKESAYAKTDRLRFESLAIEMQEFQQAVFGLQVSLEWKDRIGKDLIEVQVLMPGYGASSEYAFALELSDGSNRRTVVDRKESAFSTDPDLQPRPRQHYVSAPQPGHRSIPMDEVIELGERMALREEGGAGVLAGSVRANESYFDRVKLKFEYWPDIVHRPELKLVPGAGGANHTLVRD